MVRNFLIFVLLLIITCIITLLFCGKLRWISQEDIARGTPEVVLEKAIEMHRPYVLKLGDKEFLCIPKANMSGKNWTVSHRLYLFEEGAMKPLNLP